jgi:1-phosphofructokinase family hexose kinase
MPIWTIGFNPAIDRILECSDFHVGTPQHARQLDRLASGKAANVSRALAQVSVNSTFTTFLGKDDVPFYQAQLCPHGPANWGHITCRFVEIAGKTRENLTILDPLTHQETHIRNRGFTVTPTDAARLENLLADHLKPGDIAICSGSLCPGLPHTYISSIIDICTQKKARVVLDANGEPLLHAVKKPVWMIKPNLEELHQICGTKVPGDRESVLRSGAQLLENAEVALISLGRMGAVLLTREGQNFAGYVATARPAVRTVMCGDHLVAGFVAGHVGGLDVEHKLRLALTLATARAVSPKLDQVDPELLAELKGEVRIEKL